MSIGAQTSSMNGVEVVALFETIESIRRTPGLAYFTFRIRNHWIDGGRSRSTINGLNRAGSETATGSEPFALYADEPPVLLGSDTAPTAVEYLLHALAACMTSSLVYHASAKGIRIDEVSTRLEGDIDLHGFLGIEPDAPRGFRQIRVAFRVKANVPDDQVQDIVNLATAFSPVFDTVTRPVDVQIRLER